MDINNIQLDIIGEGNSEEYLKNLTTKYNLIDQIRFLGLKDRNYIYEHLKDYDLLIQPSLNEGFGLTVAEGMAAKIPVLVSDIDGPMEVIGSGKYGFFFKVGNAEKLAEQYIYSTERLEKIINNAYIFVKYNFDIQSTACNYIKQYKTINL